MRGATSTEHHERLNAYRIMWLFVFFDLPTDTKTDRRNYAQFRKKLRKDGFSMMQYSVYTRHCASHESAQVHIKRVKSMLPPRGQVSILQITDKQYGRIINFWGTIPRSLSPPVQQLEIF